MQISYKSVVQACDNFKILIHSSKGEEINFRFLFIQFRLVRLYLVKYSLNDKFKKFLQLIYMVSLPGTINFMYKLDQVYTDYAQTNYQW